MTDYLKQCILFLQNEQEITSFLNSLLTPAEREKIEERLRIFEALTLHKTHRKIAEELNVSITSVTRGARVLKYEDTFLKELFSRINTQKKP